MCIYRADTLKMPSIKRIFNGGLYRSLYKAACCGKRQTAKKIYWRKKRCCSNPFWVIL